MKLSCIFALVTACASTSETPPRLPAPPTAIVPAPRPRDSRAPRCSNEKPLVIRAGTVWTIAGKTYSPGEVLIVDGRIAAVGENVERPEDAEVIDAPAAHLTPGLIDTHSHLGVYPTPYIDAVSDGNEATSPVTAEVQTVHSFWPQDPGLPRALAGGVTALQILPGSANLVGGRAYTIKLHPGRGAEDLRFPGAPEGLKMACGENPKRVYGKDRKTAPSTRMGNVAGYRAAFQDAREYRDKWQRSREKLAAWEKELAAAKPEEREKKQRDKPDPPDRNLQLETLADVLDGKILVHNHCYRADEMLVMLGVAEEFGFAIRSFHHAVEAYKIRDVLAARKVGVSTWADWWGFKLEAFDGIPENAALVASAGAPAIIHSDSAVGVQRLNQEAAKALAKGRAMGLKLTDEDALRWVTANPAWALGVEDRVGTIEVGKMADLALWSGPPLSVYSRAEKVWVDGVLEHDAKKGPRRSDFELGIVEEGSP
ncbi:MAG: amidohydrolase [Myxococcota bacterium]